MRIVIVFVCTVLLAGGFAARASGGGDREAFLQARREAAQATARSSALERQARRAGSEAARARAQGEALAARIEAAEAGLTAAERRIVLLERAFATQRARLAERQQPLVRLTAALQTMARRPAALAIVRPGSVRDTVYVRSLLAATLPEIRRRTSALRAEVARTAALRRGLEEARGTLLASREELQRRSSALAGFEARQRTRSQSLSGLALAESDRALAFREEARLLSARLETRQSQLERATSLARLPGPLPRPNDEPEPADPRLPYRVPVEGRLVTGVGEISPSGVHSRGLTFVTGPRAAIVAPAVGRIRYAAPFRGYGNIVIMDHGRGWTTVITNLAELRVGVGQNVQAGALLGRAGVAATRVTVELRRDGRPVPFAQLISG